MVNSENENATMQPSSPVASSVSAPSSQFRRWIEAVGFVGIWMALGWLFSLDAVSYLLVGVPLTFLFQLGVRRAPLRVLWVRDAPEFRLGWRGIAPGCALAILPAVATVERAINRDWLQAGWALAAFIGAFAAAYALVNFRRQTWRQLTACLIWAGGIGIAWFVISFHIALGRTAPSLTVGITNLLLLFPVCFVLEEVSFRGAIDSHVHTQTSACRCPRPSLSLASGAYGICRSCLVLASAFSVWFWRFISWLECRSRSIGDGAATWPCRSWPTR